MPLVEPFVTLNSSTKLYHPDLAYSGWDPQVNSFSVQIKKNFLKLRFLKMHTIKLLPRLALLHNTFRHYLHKYLLCEG